jgi:hypothetical protein
MPTPRDNLSRLVLDSAIRRSSSSFPSVTSHFDLKRALENPDDIDAARATIAVMDPSQMYLTDSPAATRITTCVAPHGMALSRPGGAAAYVACYGEGEVSARVPVGANAEGFGNPAYGPYALTMSPGGGLLAIGNTVSKDVRFLDTTTGAMLPDLTLPLLGAPYFAAWSADEKRSSSPCRRRTPRSCSIWRPRPKCCTATSRATSARCPTSRP